MSTRLTAQQLHNVRLRAHRLFPQDKAQRNVADVVRSVVGLQAQEPAAVPLGVRVRSRGLVLADAERARADERSIVRTWAMRGTFHVVATEDLAWMQPLFGSTFIAANRRRRLELGLDDTTVERGEHLLRDVLTGRGPLTRAEMVAGLDQRGLHLEGQAIPHLLYVVALQGMLCGGPEREGEPTYVLLDEWVTPGRAWPPTEALAELVRRYLAAFGPAMPEDCAAWSGLSLRDIRDAWRHSSGEMIEVEAADKTAWLLKTDIAWLDETPRTPTVVRLLPRFDTYLLGYRNRTLMIDASHAKRINQGGGMLAATVLVDGRLVGTWQVKRRRQTHEVVVEPFDTLEADVVDGLEAEVADLARFLGVKATLTIAGRA